MQKYAIIQLDGVSDTATDQFSANDVAIVYKNSGDDIVIYYTSGKVVNIASAAALTNADAQTVFNAIAEASQTPWTETSFVIPKLSQPVNAVEGN
jgi:hypothetical protein